MRVTGSCSKESIWTLEAGHASEPGSLEQQPHVLLARARKRIVMQLRAPFVARWLRLVHFIHDTGKHVN